MNTATVEAPLPLGHFRVRVGFNPSQSDRVAKIKGMAADLINEINETTYQGTEDARVSNEFHRLKALAMTEVENAAMWATKALTMWF